MDEQISVVKLNCLNCGATLKIAPSLFEFACRYCGASQIVERGGGTIALKMLSDRIDRIEDSVEKNSAEIRFQKKIKELQNLEEKRENFFNKTEETEMSQNPVIALAMGGIILFAAYLTIRINSVIPIILAVITVIFIYLFWKKKLKEKDAKFEKSLKSYDDEIIKLKSGIAELERIIEN